MKRFNIFYKVGNKAIERKNVSKEELYAFLAGLNKEKEAELKITRVREHNEEEEER